MVQSKVLIFVFLSVQHRPSTSLLKRLSEPRGPVGSFINASRLCRVGAMEQHALAPFL